MAGNVPVIGIETLYQRSVHADGRMGSIGVVTNTNEKLIIGVKHETLGALLLELETLQDQMSETRKKAGLDRGPLQVAVRKVERAATEIDKARGDILLHLTLDNGQPVSFGFPPELAKTMIDLLEAGVRAAPAKRPNPS